MAQVSIEQYVDLSRLTLTDHIGRIEEAEVLNGDFDKALQVQSGILVLHGVEPQAMEKYEIETLEAIRTRELKSEYVARIAAQSGEILGTASFDEALIFIDTIRRRPVSFGPAMEQLDTLSLLIGQSPDPTLIARFLKTTG